VGQASVQVPVEGAPGAPGVVTVGALVVLNAAGTPVDPVDGGLLGRAFVPPGLPRPGTPTPDRADAVRAQLAKRPPGRPGARSNTTLAVIGTDAALDPATASRTAAAGHDGLARGLRPVHTLLDGDTVFALATGRVEVGPGDVVAVQAAAADAVLLAVLDAVLSAPRRVTPVLDVPAYRDLCPPLGDHAQLS
jgi:putative pantetheine hydrolase